MLLALFIFAAAGAVALSAPEVDSDSGRLQPSRAAGRQYGPGAASGAGRAAPRLPAGSTRPARALVAASHCKTAHTPHTVPSEFVGHFRQRRSSETPLPTRDKQMSPLHTLALSGDGVETPSGVLQNVHLFSDKELRPHKATQGGSQPLSEDSASASTGETSSSAASITEEGRATRTIAEPTTQQPPPPAVSTGPRGRVTTREAGGVPADTSTLSDVAKSQRAEPAASGDYAARENISLAYNEYQSSGGSGDRLENAAEQVVFTDTKSTSSSSGNAGATVVEVEISKSVVAEKETEEMIIKDTTLIVVFSCLAVLVILVCKILRYVMEYKLSKHEQRVQSRAARPPC